MEQWVLNPFVLQSFGGHWQTGESIPEKVLDTMRNSEALHVGLELFRRVSWAQLDLELHSKQDRFEGQQSRWPEQHGHRALCGLRI
eukprot:g7391.t1